MYCKVLSQRDTKHRRLNSIDLVSLQSCSTGVPIQNIFLEKRLMTIRLETLWAQEVVGSCGEVLGAFWVSMGYGGMGSKAQCVANRCVFCILPRYVHAGLRHKATTQFPKQQNKRHIGDAERKLFFQVPLIDCHNYSAICLFLAW